LLQIEPLIDNFGILVLNCNKREEGEHREAIEIQPNVKDYIGDKLQKLFFSEDDAILYASTFIKIDTKINIPKDPSAGDFIAETSFSNLKSLKVNDRGKVYGPDNIKLEEIQEKLNMPLRNPKIEYHKGDKNNIIIHVSPNIIYVYTNESFLKRYSKYIFTALVVSVATVIAETIYILYKR